ncbi:hypothetical protein HYX00_03485 [Candidatus Woesearchaeota archaeon]|nr:hypothetical protein [Candidatus Woesearchaeota archaeon]
MKVLCLCMNGVNRSKYLAGYLHQQGYCSEYGGVGSNAQNPITQESINIADVAIAVHPLVTRFLHQSLTGLRNTAKRYIELNVSDTNLPDRNRDVVNSDLEKQINRHLPL